mgnify:CR=1 FL=1
MKKKETNQEDNFDIIFFELSEDECPVQDFLDSLDDKMAAKVYGLMDVLAEHGNELREPYSKPLGDGIFELRAKVGSDITRTLYFFYVGKKIIMTNGYVKKTQKTPKSVIEIAKKYRKIFYEQEGKE